MKNENYDIVYATDDGYAMNVGISVISLLSNMKQYAQKARIHILDNGISAAEKGLLQSCVEKYNVPIKFYNIERNMQIFYRGGVKSWTNGSMTAYARLLIGSVLPSYVHKVLYLDGDSIVVNNIKPFFSQKFKQDKAVLGVIDTIGFNDLMKLKDIGLWDIDKSGKNKCIYCNSGVLMIDLEKWRRWGLEKKCIQHIYNTRAVYSSVDQDIINVVLQQYIQAAALKYNCFSSFRPFSVKENYLLYNIKRCYKNYYHKKTFQEALNEPVVIHFIGPFYTRPWFNNSNNPWTREWMDFKNQSPYKNRQLQEHAFRIDEKVNFFMMKKLDRITFCRLYGKFRKLLYDISYIKENGIHNMKWWFFNREAKK